MSGHTPGPWTFDEYGGRVCTAPALDAAGALRSETICYVHGGYGVEAPMANGHILAASLDMLEALVKVVKYADSEPDGGVTVEMHRANVEHARAAIAKATGEAA